MLMLTLAILARPTYDLFANSHDPTLPLGGTCKPQNEVFAKSMPYGQRCWESSDIGVSRYEHIGRGFGFGFRQTGFPIVLILWRGAVVFFYVRSRTSCLGCKRKLKILFSVSFLFQYFISSAHGFKTQTVLTSMPRRRQCGTFLTRTVNVC